MFVTRAPERIKKRLHRYYTGICRVEIRDNVQDPETFKIRPEIKTLFENVPCRLSHASNSLSQSYERQTTSQTIKVFLDPEYEIPAGARITIKQDGVTNQYGAASEPNVFETHQEIELMLWEDWSGERVRKLNSEI